MLVDPSDYSVIEQGWYQDNHRRGEMKEDRTRKKFGVDDVFMEYYKKVT